MTTLATLTSGINPRRLGANPLPIAGASYVRPELVPLAAYLCVEGYSDVARHHILCHVAGGGRLDEMVEESWLEQRDYPGALRYVRESVHGIGDLVNLLDPILSERGAELKVVTELGFSFSLPCGEMVCTYLPRVEAR